MKKNMELTADGAIGYIEDVTKEEWYKNPDITLYDELEQDAYNLICDYAELIGVHLVKEEPDFSLAKEVSGFIMNRLEKEFNISFPHHKSEIQQSSGKENNLIESSDKGFKNNESCALSLFNYLVSKKEIENTSESLDLIIHDINNFRGHEWLGGIKRNLETKKFFDYIKFPEFNDDAFALNRAISPSYYYKVASYGEELSKEPSLEELRDLMDENGLDELWDHPEDELDEALENCDMLVAVGFYEKGGYFVRFFDCTYEMAKVFWENERTNECKDSLDSKILKANKTTSNKDAGKEQVVSKEMSL